MRAALRALVTLSFCIGLLSFGSGPFSPTSSFAGHAYNANFSILTPAQPTAEESEAFAQQMLSRAEQYRKELAVEWLGDQLPAGVGRTFINYNRSPTEDKGLTWAADGGRRNEHTMYLSTSRDLAVGSTLKHEMVHVVLATRFPQRLPAWLEEGIASRYDDPKRKERRARIVDWLLDTRNWPRLQKVVRQETIGATDEVAYAVSASLTEFLLSRDGKEQLIRFGQSAADMPLDAALQRHYQLNSVEHLQEAWQSWLLAGRTLVSQRPGRLPIAE